MVADARALCRSTGGIQTGRLQQFVSQLSQSLEYGAACFMPVLDFLTSAGQQQMAAQCEQASAELNTALMQRRTVLGMCLDALHSYATIVSHLPLTFVDDNRNTRWQQWLQNIVCDFTSSRCVDCTGYFFEIKEALRFFVNYM